MSVNFDPGDRGSGPVWSRNLTMTYLNLRLGNTIYVTYAYLKSRGTYPIISQSISYVHPTYVHFVEDFFLNAVQQSVLFFNSQNLCEWCLDEFSTEMLKCDVRKREQQRPLMDLERLNCQWTRKQKTYQPCPESVTLKHKGWRLQPGATLLITCCCCFLEHKQNQQMHFWLLQSIF